MMILALEFSSAQRSVAVIKQTSDGQRVVAGTASDRSARSSSKPLQLVEAALAQAQLQPAEIDALLIGRGPGSYTGIRSAIAVAQGWQLARSVGVAGVSSVEALAQQSQAKGWLGKVCVVIDAQRQEFYLQSFEITARAVLSLEPLRLATRTHVLERVATLDAIAVGPGPIPGFDLGRVLLPEAHFLAHCLTGDVPWMRAEQLEPIYLREVNFVKAAVPVRSKG